MASHTTQDLVAKLCVILLRYFFKKTFFCIKNLTAFPQNNNNHHQYSINYFPNKQNNVEHEPPLCSTVCVRAGERATLRARKVQARGKALNRFSASL